MNMSLAIYSGNSLTVHFVKPIFSFLIVWYKSNFKRVN